MVRLKRAALPLLGSILAGLVLLVTASIAPAVSEAASGENANGMRVSPVSSNITINPGQSQVVTVYVQNVTRVPVTLQAIINDFTASPSEDGQPALLLNPGQYAPIHSLKRYIGPISNITLQPLEQKAVKVSITIPKGTSGGGYYGAVRFAPAAQGSENNVNLSASVASLILVRVPGNFKEQLNLASMDVRGGTNGSPSLIFTSNKDLYAAIRFQNVGDVQEQPFGKVLLMQGKTQLASYEINTSSPRGNVLPDSIRLFPVKLTNLGVFGKYTIYGNFGYGTDGKLLSGQTTFYVVPLPAILGVLVLLAIILFLIFGFPRLKRQYDRNIIRRARR